MFDPAVVSYERLLKVFWESHDPTQGFRQGNDVGTQYRSAIYAHGEAQLAAAIASRDMYAGELAKAGYGAITTEIREAPAFYFAEDYHQGYLAKNPNGYDCHTATGDRVPDRRRGEGRYRRVVAPTWRATALGAGVRSWDQSVGRCFGLGRPQPSPAGSSRKGGARET